MATPQPSSPPPENLPSGTPTPGAPTPGAQPKIVQRLLLRTAGILIVLAGIFAAVRWVQSKRGDFDAGGDSKGLMAAIRLERDGQQAVLIRPDGTVAGTKSWNPGVTDREIVWSPDGKFLFFASDRKNSTFNIFRWNPQKDDAESRTEPGGSRSNPTFAPGDSGGDPLIVAGGVVRELDPATGKTLQILPPINAEIAQSGSGDEQGTEGSFGAVYGALGKSFRIARYLPGKSSIAAIIRRDEGELLLIQNLTPVNDRLAPPFPVAAGDRIDFDIDPKSGTLVYSVNNFRWPDPSQAPPQFRQGGHIRVPFRNVVGFIDPSTRQPSIIGASIDDKVGFAWPRISPDGSRLLLVTGSVQEGSLSPDELVTMPIVEQGARQRSSLAKGEIYEPSWSADGKRIAFARRENGKRDLITMTSEGGEETNVTKGQGDYMMPLFSPQG